MYENLEDYIHDQKRKDKNSSCDDVFRNTKVVGDIDKDHGVTCKETSHHDESKQDNNPNPDRLTITSKKSEPEGSQHVKKVNKECDSQAKQAAVVVSNQVPQPVSNVLTLPSGQTSLVNTIGQNEPKGSQLQLNTNDGENELKGSQLQLNMNNGENNIPSANDSNEFTVPQTDGPSEYEPMYELNTSVDHLNKSNMHMDENSCAVNPNNYIQEKNSNVAENAQI